MNEEDKQILKQRALWLPPGVILWVLGFQFSIMVWPNSQSLMGTAVAFTVLALCLLLPSLWMQSNRPPFLQMALFLLPIAPLLLPWAWPSDYNLLFIGLSALLLGSLFLFSKLLKYRAGTRLLLIGYLILLIGFLYRSKEWPGWKTMQTFGSFLLLLGLLIIYGQLLWGWYKSRPVHSGLLDD